MIRETGLIDFLAFIVERCHKLCSKGILERTGRSMLVLLLNQGFSLGRN